MYRKAGMGVVEATLEPIDLGGRAIVNVGGFI